MPDLPTPVVLNTPEQRMAFLKEHGVPEGFYIVSGQELFAIDQGTSKLRAQIRNWQVLAQAIFGVTTAEEALEVAKRQKAHRQGIMDDRMRFRETLVKILQISKEERGNPEFDLVWKLASNAINNAKPEGKE
jgi:hypothetical protein